MNAGAAVEGAARGGPSLAERAAAILRDEIANGALASVGLADKRWSTIRHDLGALTPFPINHTDDLLRAVLELIAPVGVRPPLIEPVFTPPAGREVEPGGSAVITLAVQNDRPLDVEVGFTWSDLVAPPDRRIEADRIRLIPQRVRIPTGGTADLAIILHVPAAALSGQYRTLIQAADDSGLSALLTFPVGRLT